jgi:hypothetical protein
MKKIKFFYLFEAAGQSKCTISFISRFSIRSPFRSFKISADATIRLVYGEICNAATLPCLVLGLLHAPITNRTRNIACSV